jgi:HK97 family phage portal protein
MSLFARRALGDTPNNLIPSRRTERTGSVTVTPDTSLRTSAVWACQRLRADLVSTMPLDVFRRVNGRQVEVPKPAVLMNPGGSEVGIQEWLYSTQFDLDRMGNTFGVISELDGMGNPARIDLVDASTVRVTSKDGVVTYYFGRQKYSSDQVWHERQFTVSGHLMGLSPVSYAAWSIGQFQSAANFGLEWFGNGGTIPSGHFKNTSKTVSAAEGDALKTRFKASVANRDVLVTGSDWDYNAITTQQNEAQFIETQKFTLSDIARFYGVPGDLIDVAPVGKSSLTYASITQRNLQFLIMNLGAVFARREVALSRLLANPRYVKFNTDALLRMDPDTRNAMMIAQVAGKTRTPSEVREMDNLPPFTAAQIQEFEDLGIITETVDPVGPSGVDPEMGEMA